jgi:hypothetical protein
VVAAGIVFVGFVATLGTYKGDPSWGPRYLTPVASVLWLFAPMGAALLKPRLVALVLGLGLVVQLLALSVDPHRLYINRGVPSAFSSADPWAYFYPALAHLPNRPVEIYEIATQSEPAEVFTPSPSPTFAFPIINQPYLPETGPGAVRRYHVLNSFRPWWISQRFLPETERPVDLDRTVVFFLLLAAGGIAVVCLALGVRRSSASPMAVTKQ